MRTRSWALGVLASLVALFAFLLLRTAWLCDDAYITLRCVDLFIGGHGPVFNVGERVQAFTHPLWMLLVAGGYALTGEAFGTTLALGLACTAATLLLLVRGAARGMRAAALLLLLLCLSRAFVDFSTSGLENPLTHLLVAAFVAVTAAGEPSVGRLRIQSLLVGLALLTRLDLAVLFGPLLIGATCAAAARGATAAATGRPATLPRRTLLAAAAIGLALPAAWCLFALVYYGSPFPNTAFAKLATAVPAAVRWRQGGFYLLNALQTDPLTPAVIAAGIVVAAATRGARSVALALVLHVVYVVSVGGDFMAGRFLTPAFLLAAAWLAGRPWLERPRIAWSAAAGALVLGLLAPRPTVRSCGSDYGLHLPLGEIFDAHGIADERAVYYRVAGLLRSPECRQIPEAQEIALHQPRPDAERSVVVKGLLGFFSFTRGAPAFVIDPHGLSDPFLARLPPANPVNARVGHWARFAPKGYIESIWADRNLVADPGFHALYEAVRTVTRGPLFTRARWREIWKLHTGAYAVGPVPVPTIDPPR